LFQQTKAKEISMIGKILGGIVGAQAAQHTSKVGGAGGALLGAASAGVLRRMSIPAMLAVGAGGYAVKKWSDRREADKAGRKNFESPPRTSKAAT
jgi:hypothetical protein